MVVTTVYMSKYKIDIDSIKIEQSNFHDIFCSSSKN